MERMLLWMAAGTALGAVASVLLPGSWLLPGIAAGLCGADLLVSRARWRRWVLLLTGIVLQLAAFW